MAKQNFCCSCTSFESVDRVLCEHGNSSQLDSFSSYSVCVGVIFKKIGHRLLNEWHPSFLLCCFLSLKIYDSSKCIFAELMSIFRSGKCLYFPLAVFCLFVRERKKSIKHRDKIRSSSSRNGKTNKLYTRFATSLTYRFWA